MITITVFFSAVKTPDGTIHVQNYIGGYRGQHHIHSEESFKRWAEQIDPKDLHISEGECQCGLTKPGQVREYDGHEWFNDTFLTKCPTCENQDKCRSGRILLKQTYPFCYREKEGKKRDR